MLVYKSNKTYEDYDPQKVYNGICEAYTSIGEDCQKELIDSLIKNLFIYDKISSKEIRRQIEESLMSINKKVARAYMSKYQQESELAKKNDFIHEYIKASNASTGSKYDSNANVTSKNIVTMGQELYKLNNIRQNRYIMQDKIKTMFTKKLANKYVDDLESHVLYKHDETAIPGQPYTFSCKEVVNISYNNAHTNISMEEERNANIGNVLYDVPFVTVSMEELWDMVKEEAICVDKENDVWQKFPKSMTINDYNGKKTQVTRITKKLRKRDLVRVVMDSGEDIVVTDNHPMIIDKDNLDNTVEAINSVGHKQYREENLFINNAIDYEIYSNSRDYILKLSTILRGQKISIDNVRRSDGKWGLIANKGKGEEKKEAKIISVEKIADNDPFLAENKYIFDISTESHSFVSNNLLVHNCVAITMYPFLTDGLQKLGGPSKAPTDLKSFCGQFINLVYSVSSQFAGACATPEFLAYLDYFIRKDYGEDYIHHLDKVVDDTRKKRTIEKVIENCFQQVVHSMNMPAGNRGYQSVFWNVGYFDKNYFDGVFSDFRFPDGTPMKWESISWLQKKFMKWFNEERTKYVLTFPVETMAMLTDGHDVVDKEYADFTSEMWAEGGSFFCYLSDSPDSLSSCCFEGLTQPIYKDPEENDGIKYFDTFADIYKRYGTKKIIKAWQVDPQTGKQGWKDVKLVKATVEKMLTVSFGEQKWKGESKSKYQLQCTEDHKFPVLTESGKILTKKAKDLKEGDSLISNHSEYDFNDEKTADLQYKKIVSVKENHLRKETDVYCFKFVNKDDAPFFMLSNGIISHNCRLRNSLKDMEDTEHNHTQHQFSMGTASVATGSKGVMTINLNRLIQNAVRKYYKEIKNKELPEASQINLKKEDKKQIYQYIDAELNAMVEDTHKYQKAFNSIIKDFYEAKMLDVYTAGFISMNKQYLTIGVNGLTDAAEFLGLDITPNDDYKEYVNNILETINKCNKKDRTKECMFNTEFVPGENLSNKNYTWDKKDGYYVSPKHIMYSSYFFNPEDENVSVLDKMELHGTDYVKWCDGGQAAHINLKEHLSQAQYRQLLKVAAEDGCNYFTFNIRNTVCNDCGYISKNTLDECPRCHGHNLDYLTRIIGYLKRVSSFNEARQVEEHMRAYNELD
jgi:anaerobic ribonucleoside-triphosphate reductase